MSNRKRLTADALTRTDPVTFAWEGKDVTVAPYADWRASTVRAMRQGDFQTWAEAVLDEDSLDHWDDVDPVLEQVNVLFHAWVDASGTDPGESSASRTSSRRTAKR